MSAERFEHRPLDFVGIVSPRVVFIGVGDRAKFDMIDLPLIDHGENENGHCLTKSIQAPDLTGALVVFQYWIKSRTTEALMADLARERKEAVAKEDLQRRAIAIVADMAARRGDDPAGVAS